jgi:hypothetical protein
MQEAEVINTISEVVQLAVAPVFLLTGIAGILAVLSLRLGRVIDRGRLLDERITQSDSAEFRAPLLAEAGVMWRRIRILNWAIGLFVMSALLVCLVVVCMFVGDFLGLNAGTLIATLFVFAMLLVIGGLVLLLVEVSISTHNVRQSLEHQMVDSNPAIDK